MRKLNYVDYRVITLFLNPNISNVTGYNENDTSRHPS